ncbi:hypothetical protein [Levyella massiliensis]|uniref:hypothetical protein n=1 Tax=Levyella massiliensis TaxID=938289 RepID=UPI000372005C|nr:hypothetical protein [Levyella massiliensis]
MKEKHKHIGKILFSVLLVVAFIVFAGIKPIYANILSPKQGINEYHFYDNTIENKDSANEIQKQIILNGKKISDPGHVFKDKSKVLENGKMKKETKSHLILQSVSQVTTKK